MAVAERQDDRIVLQTEFREKELVKTVPGARWDKDLNAWWVPLSWAACQQLRGVFGVDLSVGPALTAWSRELIETRVNPCLALRDADDAPDLAGILTSLMPFQRAGVQFLATAKQALLADEMGLGKTVQAIAALEVLGEAAYPVLIVCPNSMKLTWESEFKRWAPSREPVVISGTADRRKKAIAALAAGEANVGIINYEALRSHTRLAGYGGVTLTDDEKKPKELNGIGRAVLNEQTGVEETVPGFATVIADEAHRAKDPRAKQTRALWYVGGTADYRFALTGTPVANSPEDVWTLMRFVSPPDFPAKTKFIERYAMQSWNVFGFLQIIGIKSETSDELFRIIDPRFIRRTKAMVLPQLPPITYSIRYCDLVPKQKKAYDEMRKEQYAELESGILLATNPLVKLTRLLQFASAYGQLGDPAFEVRVKETDGKRRVLYTFPDREQAESYAQQCRDAGWEDIDVRDATPLLLTEPSCKVDALVEILAEVGDQQVVVFAQSSQLIDIAEARLQKEGFRTGKISGAVQPHDRQQAVAAFQAGDLKVLLLTIGAGGEGLTLTAASTAIFLQRSFNYVQNQQAEARIHRIGQEAAAIEVIDIVTAGTAEQRVHESGIYKAERAEEIVRDEETMKRWLAK